MQSEVEKWPSLLRERIGSEFDNECHLSGDEATQLASLIERLYREKDELEALFDLQHSADMRAVKRWRDANPGNDLVLPDHADMVVWLLERTAEIREALRPFAAFLPKAEAFVEKAAVTPGHSPIMPAIKDFRVADFRRAARALAGEDVQG